ncbi:hypothetical protein BV898_18505 [Hypsibius exemplaris]|uniref:Tc1-like transposase DDE domain-containing protein n=1 Tax=Hypsibius exemplaris TaxID=2072580 RepID=A0A9X6NPA3_HYPEX|nr:hypothetical protein BV898_18505 [Hypsibius exemplaris]
MEHQMLQKNQAQSHPETQRKRRKCAMNLRKTIRMSDVPNMLFLNECYICVGKYFNHQNERCYGYSLETIGNGKKFKQFPKTALCAMVFGAVSFSGRSPLVVLKSGFSLNQHTYKNSCLKPMLEDLPYGTVQAFLKEKMPCFIPNADIPPHSSDLNPFEYCVWSLLKERINKHGLISSFDRLAKILRDEWKAISQQVIQDSISFWMSRVRKVEKARGSHIE